MERMEKQLTAVEWLAKELETYGDPQFCELEWEQLDSLIEQAKEIEKEQMLEVSKAGCFGTFEFEDYYNENYKSE
jgi:hypothetical protein